MAGIAATDGLSSPPLGTQMASPEPESLPTPPVANDAEIRRLQELLAAFRSTEKGCRLHDTFGQVRKEIGYLVRNCRPVKVAWHRHEGPRFLTQVQSHLRGASSGVPHEFNGVSRNQLLESMGDVLKKHGSNPLRSAIEQHGKELITTLSQGESAHDWIDYLQSEALATTRESPS
jgi:hypothetical protein